MATCLVGLGSNIGDRQRNIRTATDAITAISSLLARSALYATRPIGGPAEQEEFLNAAALVETDRSPREVLDLLQQVEHRLGRQREQRWGPRTIDLDLLLYDQVTVETPELIVPHPRFVFRRFVLEPAAEIAGSMLHPITRFTVQELLERLDRKPLHVSILASDAAEVAAALAMRTPGARLSRPASTPSPQSSPDEVFAFIAQVQESWNALALESHVSIISDFWLGEIWTAVSDSWSVADKQKLEAAWSDLPNPLVAPHLVVWLQSSLGDPQVTGELLKRLDRPRQFPVFKLKDCNPETVLAEVTAAVEAMSN